MASGDGGAYWQRDIADMRRPPDVQGIAAHLFSNQLALGALAGLKRCAEADCRKFFIGRPNKKWCSDSCGSRSRVRRKRRRDIE
jgi:predicted RNA-binding Zn ribbon-like protein